MFLSLTLGNPVSAVISIIVILVLVSDIIAGYKKGFLENTIKFLRVVISMLIAYLFKGSLSSYLYLNYPFFNLDGIFKGVSSVNILIYEVLAFFVLYIIVSLILKIICDILKLEERLLRLISIIGVPNKIMGAIFGGLKSLIFLYFILSLFFVVSTFFEIDTGESLGDYIVDIPILKNTFGSVLDSFDQISELALEYEHIQDKSQLNTDAIDILLKYDIISEDNLELLIESGKVDYSITDAEEQKNIMEDLYESIIK